MTGIYIGVDGKARKVKGVHVGIDGKARKVKKGYVGDENGIARLCYSEISFDPVFANNTWEGVITACQNNAVPDTWLAGDQKTMNIDGVDYTIDIIGKNHDDYTDGGKAPLTFQLHDCYNTMYVMNGSQSNIGGWRDSLMRQTHLPNIMSLMPLEVQSAIREVNKLTTAGSTSSVLYTTADKLFLLSEIEVFGVCSVSLEGEGEQYEYYAIGNNKVKSVLGTAQQWWERSPHKSVATAFCVVDKIDNASTSYSNNSKGVSFAFCF